MTGFFTVCNRYQLPGAIALGESVLRFHPGARYVIGLADDSAGSAVPAGMELIPIAALQIPRLQEMSGRYLDYEFVHAVRPWFAKHLLEQSENRFAWVFLAPTVLVFSPLDFLGKYDSDFLLTPNLTGPLPASRNLDDKRILNIGMFNADAWMARATPEVKSLFDWWRTRTIDRAFFDLCNGMCLDQLWLNYVPVLLREWTILRDTNWHVGLHNLLRVALENSSGETPSADGKPLLTFNFAGLTGFHPVWSDHTQVLSGNPAGERLLRNYKKQLAVYEKTGPDKAHYGRPSSVPAFRDFRRAIKSELNHVVSLIDKIEI
ncbi:hypothetical protein [Ravibacter arvi]|uniref:hypothetical protein n=1 Tax=Ravibacter arvi TaxID=2051041 RepID=UPI0031E50367